MPGRAGHKCAGTASGMVGPVGFEPTTLGLKGRYSTVELGARKEDTGFERQLPREVERRAYVLGPRESDRFDFPFARKGVLDLCTESLPVLRANQTLVSSICQSMTSRSLG